MKMLKFLVIEDERNLSDSIADMLRRLGKVEQVFNGEDGLYQAEKGVYDLIILDLMLPGLDGFTILNELRRKKINTPVLILSAKDSLEDKVRAFKDGTDDYLTKPFHREELMLRVKALLKRSMGIEESNVIENGNLKINLNNHVVTYEDRIIQLQGKEFDLLLYLVQNKDVIVTKEQIFDRIWGFDSSTSITVVEVYMSNLRKQLKKQNVPNMIRTLRNVGYIWENPSED
ncbi:response regulator transcription factor [Catellicoccus marimammalium]|uniref:Two component system response regulator CiaR n=2 Tax=Catellicoccus TaxID=300418 RepID=K8ZNT0_9ENTE|nr:Two component system response regulator CiaR [Catellicoccus marimammalium M35/04/3]